MSRMVPIVFAIIPTIIGAAMLIGLNGSGEKGVLLFGMLQLPIGRLEPSYFITL